MFRFIKVKIFSNCSKSEKEEIITSIRWQREERSFWCEAYFLKLLNRERTGTTGRMIDTGAKTGGGVGR